MRAILECHTRPAVAEDIDRVLEVMAQGRAYQRRQGNIQWADDYPSRELITRDIERGWAMVWEVGGQVEGFAAVKARDDGYDGVVIPGPAPRIDWCVVHRLALSDCCRGKGMAQQFLCDIIAIVFAAGTKEVRIDTGLANTAMQHVAERLGFRLLGEAQFSWGPRLVYSRVADKRD